MKKNMLIRGLDDDTYRKAKAAAALRGIPLGEAINQALAEWAGRRERPELRREVEADRKFVRKHWRVVGQHKGKAVVVAGGSLRGVFDTLGEARNFSSRYEVALTFVVGEPPLKGELEIGPELEV